MKIQWGNIGKVNNTEDKIVRVEWPMPEDEPYIKEDILWVTRMLPPLSILQLSDVWIKTKKTFKSKAGKALVVWQDEKSIEFWNWGWWLDPTPVILTYDANLTVDLSEHLNYVLTLTWDCNLTLENIIEWYDYQFIIIQDNVWWHTLNIMHPCYYQQWYSQDTTANSHSKLIIDKIDGKYYASISKYDQLIANITWEDYDWTTLDTSTTPYWETPVYTWPTPTRAWYVFIWWTPSLWPVFWNMTYTATYEWALWLKFEANTAWSTIKLDWPSYNYLQYSTDWNSWSTYRIWKTITLSSIWDKVYFKSSIDTNSFSGRAQYSRFTFVMTWSIACSWPVTYLINTNWWDVALLSEWCFADLFYWCTSLTTAPELPSTNLSNWCYWWMFWGCENLVTAPELPATTLTDECYRAMFYWCTSLITAPQLPATDLSYAGSCYRHMFYWCTSLTTAPELPATTLADYCYSEMFDRCTSLTTAPQLPATTLAEWCYYRMFYWCTSLTTAPQLPATTLANNCYEWMFLNCTNLTTAPALSATTLANNCYESMFNWCTSLTTAPELPATTLVYYCYHNMFRLCSSLTATPELPATTLAEWCYYRMFYWCSSLATLPELSSTNLAVRCYEWMFNSCSNIKLSTTQTWIYQTSYRIPTIWTWIDASRARLNMFTWTWWTFTWTPSKNTTYYTSNTVV